MQALKSISGDISSGELRAERYAVTDFLLAIFTQKVQSKGLTAEHLTVPAIKMVQTIEREPAFHGMLQPLELDSWNVIDFTMDSMCEKDRSISEFLQAFMHWTYHRTNGELVLVVKKVSGADLGILVVSLRVAVSVARQHCWKSHCLCLLGCCVVS